MKQPIVYIAGPMRGLPDFNYPAFANAAARFRALNLAVINPAENFGGRQDLEWETYMRADIGHVLTSDGIVMLEGWEGSEGATLEHSIATAIGLEVWYDLPGGERRFADIMQGGRS